MRADMVTQGIDPDEVKTLHWKDEFITEDVRLTIEARKRHKNRRPPFENCFNCVEMQSGEFRQLVPPLHRPY